MVWVVLFDASEAREASEPTLGTERDVSVSLDLRNSQQGNKQYNIAMAPLRTIDGDCKWRPADTGRRE